jgi:hypothetical protein
MFYNNCWRTLTAGDAMEKNITHKIVDEGRCTLNVNASINQCTIKIHMTVIVDSDEMDDDRSNLLIDYMSPYLPGYKQPHAYWWSRMYKDVTVKTGTQARHVVDKAIDKVTTAYHAAILDRERRFAELKQL